jgi:RHS repeat-associated protein
MNKFRSAGFSVFAILSFYSGVSQSSTGEYEEIIYYHSDALGSPIAATNANGDLLWREELAPYGSRLLHQSRESDCGSGSCVPLVTLWDEKQWFTGKLEETSNGIQYFGARWYEPELGRFLSVDPVTFREDNIFTFNRYAYANNNPYKFTDPDGREVVQVGFSFALPEVLGAFQKLIGREIEVSGFTLGVAWSSPNIYGAGEYDIGMYLTTRLNAEGADTGRAVLIYSESVDDSDSVKDLAGVGGGASAGFGLSGLNTSYSGEGIEMIGFHIGPGVGVTVQGEATIVYSNKHGKVEWNSPSQDNNSKATKRKKIEE